MLKKCIIVLALGLLLAAPVSARLYKGDDTMLVSPCVFVMDYEGSRLTIHTEIPFAEVVRSTVVLIGLGGEAIEPVSTMSDLRGNLVAKFAADDVRMIVEVPRTELELYGFYRSGETFTLNATISVK